MDRTLLTTILTGCVLAAAPAIAQQSQNQESQMIQNQKVVVPLQVETKQVMQLQQKLNQDGFSAGPVNGLWDRETSAAVHNFQVSKGLEPSGQLDQKTLSALGVQLMSSSGSSSSGSSSGGSSQMSEQQAQQMLQSQGYSQVQLTKQGQEFTGTAAKSGQQYQVAVSQDGQVQAQPKQQ